MVQSPVSSPGAVALADALRQNCSLQHLAASFMAKVADGWEIAWTSWTILDGFSSLNVHIRWLVVSDMFFSPSHLGWSSSWICTIFSGFETSHQSSIPEFVGTICRTPRRWITGFLQLFTKIKQCFFFTRKIYCSWIPWVIPSVIPLVIQLVISHYIYIPSVKP